MPNEWLKIREWHGSQNHAFEELCCQLAADEPAPKESRFIRKGTPDGGVECLRTLADGEEWGWQAKFFVSALGDGEWSQLDESIQTAIKAHPHLTKYTFCLPINLPGGSVRGRKNALQKWDEHLERWQAFARKRGMNVKIERWGDSELLARLSRDENRGRRFFWFNSEVLSQQWFSSRIDEAVANAGARYTPELSVDLPIARNFDGLARAAEFFARIAEGQGKVRRASAYCSPGPSDEINHAPFRKLDARITALLRKLGQFKVYCDELVPVDALLREISDCSDATRDCLDAVQTWEKSQAANEQPKPTSRGYQKSPREYQYCLGKLQHSLGDLAGLLRSPETKLSNLPALLVVGDAGSGKTHLLCDVARKRLAQDAPCVLILGEHLTGEDPWQQIITLLGLHCSRDEFLGAMDAAGSAGGSRALLMIDALNEGNGPSLWPKHLAGALTTISRYPHIGVVLTVRSSYVSSVIPEEIGEHKLVRITHEGFSDNEYRAARAFFDFYKIQHPSVPLLTPEFQNPLFLKTFCQALSNLGLNRVPSGLAGITRLLDFFLDSINTKLSKPGRMNFDAGLNPVKTAVRALAGRMAAAQAEYLPYAEAHAAVNAVLPSQDGFEQSLFRNLFSEGVLAKERLWAAETPGYRDVVRFAYQRFTDHLIAEFLLGDDFCKESAPSVFGATAPIGKLFGDEPARARHRGLLEAVCVQVPERAGTEVPDLLEGRAVGSRALRLAFIESLIWRSPDAVSDKTLRYINSEVTASAESHASFLNALLTLAAYPQHPYNARMLHRHLLRPAMADRDSWWTTFLHWHYGEGGAIDRLIDWAWFAPDKTHIGDDSALLAAMALCWFLTSSNRYLRDRATKALVSLLTSRINVLRQLLGEFRAVNDLYVAERLYCVAYGCCLRSTDRTAIASLAQDVYEFVFRDGYPLPHALLRDYARGIIEAALHNGAQLKVDQSLIRPPYATKLAGALLSLSELEKRYGVWRDGMTQEEMGSHRIFVSVVHDDFGTYVIEPACRKLSNRRLGKSRRPSYKDRYDAFVQSLSKKQLSALREYEADLSAHRMNSLSFSLQLSGESKKDNEKAIRKLAHPNVSRLRSILGAEKYGRLTSSVLPFLENPSIDNQRDAFAVQLAQRWILKRVLDLGWDGQKLGAFDRYFETRKLGREAHKAERIGKKYQWIAFHQFLAAATDTFVFAGEPWEDRPAKYDGPWQLWTRDIDPSVLMIGTAPETKATWWAPVTYTQWEREDRDDQSWISDFGNAPDPSGLLAVTNPADGSRWLALEGWHRWKEPTPAGEEEFEKSRREVWTLVRCYLVRGYGRDTVFRWASQQDFMGRWMPENGELYRVFLGEFAWAPAFQFHNSSYYEHKGWTQAGRAGNELAEPVLACADHYLGESSSLDCSLTDSVNITLPAKFIIDGMGLQWNGIEGSFFDSDDRLAAYDPSLTTPGPSVLLIRADLFDAFLRKFDCDLFWMTLGEKQLIGGHLQGEDWKGRLEMSGAFRRAESGVEGCVTKKYVSRKQTG